MFRLTSIESVMEHVADFQTLSYTIIEDVGMPSCLLPDMADASFLRCDFAGATMPDNLENGLFVDCRMGGLSFTQANLFNARFVRCDLSHSRSLDCDLSAVQFEGCALATTEFSNCDPETTEIAGGDCGGSSVAA